ncbi:flavin reductase family protein [Halomonas sp. QX-2]|uniref:Flavin reductase family protein n=1 Tax=Vreelandella sedimenti TaxID=2729618 RepID=A0A7Z0SPK4_9GAMM|nr:flavin reductase family protein [Halomonas sedimenti]NYT74990.1 flavin reductase family protein [Halomonas sedimenti]
MFYEPSAGHGLAYDPFKAIIAPRPIGWISTLTDEGVPNLAPYSFFNAMSSRPPMVGFTSEGMKDSPRNAQATREFVYNLATMPLSQAMSESSASLPHGENEFDYAGLEMAPSRLVKPPRVARAPAALECRTVHYSELLDLDGKPTDRYLVIGQVVGVYINEEYIRDGRFDTVAAQSLARCGYRDYAVVERVFELLRPDER